MYKDVNSKQTVQTLHLKHYRSLKIKEKHNMDILSFILGMSIVVVIAVAVVAVVAFVRVNRHNKDIEELHQVLGREIDNQNRERENDIQNVYRTLDSRLDKLESKFTTSRKA
jgi:transcription initiation factor TFIIIB Brf1 subunit/transcription initiation factor TFIIB